MRFRNFQTRKYALVVRAMFLKDLALIFYGTKRLFKLEIMRYWCNRLQCNSYFLLYSVCTNTQLALAYPGEIQLSWDKYQITKSIPCHQIDIH